MTTKEQIHKDIMELKPSFIQHYIFGLEEDKERKKYFSGENKKRIYKRKKSDFLGKGKWNFTFKCYEKDLTEEQKDYLKNLGVESYKNNKI